MWHWCNTLNHAAIYISYIYYTIYKIRTKVCLNQHLPTVILYQAYINYNNI